jgi:uncharacterized membrane protein
VSEPGRFILATLCGLVLAALVHIGVVFGVPWLGERDAFSRLRSTMSAERSELVAGTGGVGTWLPRPDPAVALGACAYDLRQGPVRVSTKTTSLFESMSLHSRAGGVFFALTDRAAVRGVIDLVIMTRAQLDEALAREDEDEPSRDVRIVSPTREGLVIIRVLAPQASRRPEAEDAAKAVSCTAETVGGA